jgi:hypothetical protein
MKRQEKQDETRMDTAHFESAAAEWGDTMELGLYGDADELVFGRPASHSLQWTRFYGQDSCWSCLNGASRATRPT